MTEASQVDGEIRYLLRLLRAGSYYESLTAETALLHCSPDGALVMREAAL